MALPVATIAVRATVTLLQTKTGRAIIFGLVLALLLIPILVIALGAGILASVAGQQAAIVAEESDNGRCVDPPVTSPYNPNEPGESGEGLDPGNLVTIPGDGGLVIHGQSWDAEQVANLRVIIGVAKAIG